MATPEDLVPTSSSNDCHTTSHVLETMDSCVGFVEGVDEQHSYEADLPQMELIDRVAASVALDAPPVMPEIDLLNICGGDDDDEIRKNPRKFMAMDTTNSLLTDDKPCTLCEEGTLLTLPCCPTRPCCIPCLWLLGTPSNEGRVTRCPHCRAWLLLSRPSVDEATVASSTEPALLDLTLATNGHCDVCHEDKDSIVSSSTCDACFLGQQLPLLYDCQDCGQSQRIPHPLYRYQASPNDASTVAWPCHGSCRKLTSWKLAPHQLLPAGENPWEAEDLQLRVLAAKGVLASSSSKGSSCAIM